MTYLPEPKPINIDWEKKPSDKEFANRIRQCVADLHEAIRVATIAGLDVETQLQYIGYAGFYENGSVTVYRKMHA